VRVPCSVETIWWGLKKTTSADGVGLRAFVPVAPGFRLPFGGRFAVGRGMQACCWALTEAQNRWTLGRTEMRQDAVLLFLRTVGLETDIDEAPATAFSTMRCVEKMREPVIEDISFEALPRGECPLQRVSL